MIFLDGVTLDLVFYEALNAVWKEYKLLKRINEETATEYIDVLAEVFKAIETTNIKGYEKETFKLAVKENLTIYDAAYLLTEIKRRLVLVTDDKKLRDKALKYVETMDSNKVIEIAR